MPRCVPDDPALGSAIESARLWCVVAFYVYVGFLLFQMCLLELSGCPGFERFNRFGFFQNILSQRVIVSVFLNNSNICIMIQNQWPVR